MKKIPCLFVRIFWPNRSFVITPQVTPGCEWVLAGEGVATLKRDGTACLIREGKLYARYDAKPGRQPPPGSIPCEPEADPKTGHWPHWVEVLDQPAFKWVRLAQENELGSGYRLEDGTYEAVGPKINANNDGQTEHRLLRHGDVVLGDVPRTFDGLRSYLERFGGEGVVFHHSDGRMAKIRRDDFGFPWGTKR